MPPPSPRNTTQSSTVANPFAQLQAAFTSLTPSILLADKAIQGLSQTPFAALQRGISAIQSQIVQFVQYANPAAVIQFKLAWESLQGVIGRSLTPVLQSFTLIVQQLANYLNTTDSSGKALIAVLAVLGVVTGVVTGAVAGLSAALIVFKLVMDVATGGLTAIASAIGLVVGGLTAAGVAGAGLTLAFSPLESLKGIINAVGPPLMMLVNMIGSLFEAFASGAVPGIISAFDSLGDALKTVLASLGDGGDFFKMLGQSVAVAIQEIALAIQFAAVIFDSFIATVKMMIDVFADGENVVDQLSSGFENLMVWLKAASMILAGDMGEQKDGPGKAPPGARQATSQNISSFITKSYVSALQGGAGGDQGFRNGVLQKMDQINEKAKEIADNIKEFLDRVSEAKDNAINGAQDFAGGVAQVAGVAPVMAVAEGAWAAQRALVNRVVGK